MTISLPNQYNYDYYNAMREGMQLQDTFDVSRVNSTKF